MIVKVDLQALANNIIALSVMDGKTVQNGLDLRAKVLAGTETAAEKDYLARLIGRAFMLSIGWEKDASIVPPVVLDEDRKTGIITPRT